MARRTPKTKQMFSDAARLNSDTYFDYLDRMKKIATSLFEWTNLPESMNARFLEQCLYYKGQAALLFDEDFGFVNTQVASEGSLNIYGLPTVLNCYSYEYQSTRKLYVGNYGSKQSEECILVMNNHDRIPTCATVELFAERLAQAERTIDTNIKLQKIPLIIDADENTRFTLQNAMAKIDGNSHVIVVDKNAGIANSIQVLRTDTPYLADKLMEYKKSIWNEFLTFIGVNNIDIEKKERLIASEATTNNEVVNLNLMSYLAPRKEAAKQFNEKFGLTGTSKEIGVRVRSDLYNIIKEKDSLANDYDIDGDGITDLGEGA